MQKLNNCMRIWKRKRKTKQKNKHSIIIIIIYLSFIYLFLRRSNALILEFMPQAWKKCHSLLAPVCQRYVVDIPLLPPTCQYSVVTIPSSHQSDKGFFWHPYVVVPVKHTVHCCNVSKTLILWYIFSNKFALYANIIGPFWKTFSVCVSLYASTLRQCDKLQPAYHSICFRHISRSLREGFILSLIRNYIISNEHKMFICFFFSSSSNTCSLYMIHIWSPSWHSKT